MKSLLALFCLLLLATAAGAETIKLAWTASTGPVANYAVQSTRNGEPWAAIGATADALPEFSITLDDGEVHQFRVFGRNVDGVASPFSPASVPIVIGEGRTAITITAPGQPVLVMP